MIKFIRPEDLCSISTSETERQRIVDFIMQKNNRGYVGQTGFALVSKRDDNVVVTELTCYGDVPELLDRLRKDFKAEPQIVLDEHSYASISEFKRNLPNSKCVLMKNFYGNGKDGIKFSLPTS